MEPPGYFEQVRAESAAIWETLESSPVLAGPWHRMFQQVQSPRHVLSELLQNADDSGATWASARVVDDTFVFEHNGRDFIGDEFASLCRFGYSNKRALHTIGFRGVGFKSTFSLGKEVHLSTPSLSVKFTKSRFTEPVWTPEVPFRELTTIEVQLTNQGAKKELEKNLAEWLTSSASLLFFRNIRTLQVNDTELSWVECGNGPCPNSTWLKLDGADQSPCLLVRSNLEPFPAEALEEIQAERILTEEEHLDMPPCSVELLLYGDSRLFVVLPTGVKTKLPFAANAPFVQDTARLKVKDPDSSPTNRWLLERIGKLAADSMLAWLNSSDASSEFLAQAYDLMPNVDREESSLEGSCAATVEIAFDAALENRKYVLTDANRLVASGECLEVPSELMEVWSASELGRILAQDTKSMASRHLSDANLKKLRDWQAIVHIPRTQVVQRLKQASPTKPQSWKQMLKLWSYLSEDIPSFEWGNNDLRGLRVVPVQGQQALFAANEVIRLGEKRLLASDDDWTFMSGHLRAYNPNWSRFLAEQRKIAERDGDAESANEVDRAYRLQNHFKLTDSSDTNQVMRQVAADFYSAGQVAISDCVRLAQIGARLGASLGPEFRFVSKNKNLVQASKGVIADETGRVADIVPEDWADAHLLHDSYWSTWTSCTRQEWLEWIESGKASLARFPALVESAKTFWSKKEFDAALESRGFAGTYDTPYKTQHFELADSDFEASLWKHWKQLAANDECFWASLVQLVLDQGPAFWEKALDAKAVQIATTGSKRQIISSGILPSWVRKLRGLPCLRDTRGVARKPSEVMRRTAATEPLLDVEPFIPVDVDTEANRPLLKALKVRSTPTGPKQILERIRALAETATPPVEEVEKWYRRLDGLFLNCTSEEVREIRELFESEPLILSESHGWVRSQEVFISATADDVPDTPLIRPSVRDLELWRRIHVADRPNAELILHWLRELPVGEPLPAEVVRRVKPALARLGVTAWEQCGHWLNISNEWVATSEIRYSVSMRSLTKTQELFPSVKQASADFQMLDFDSLDRYPFADVPSLASCLDEQVSSKAVQSFVRREKPWLGCLAKNLARIEVSSEVEQARLRAAAIRLAQTEWKQGAGLETVPYLDGVPVGAARRVPAVWSGTTLYVAEASVAQMAAPVAREIARGFDHVGIGDAVKFCFERDPAFILDYLEQEFTLSKSLFDNLPQPSEAPQNPTESPSGEVAVATASPTDANDGASVEQQAESPVPKEQDSEQGSNPPPPADSEPNRNQQHRERPEKPSLVERFAAAKGLRPDGNGKFIGVDGTILQRAQDSAFPWELRQPGREESQFLMPSEHCLERESIVLDAEVWSLLRSSDAKYVLLLLAPDSSPILRTGSDLAKDIENRRIALYPAKYRLSSVP
jgi:hypothetical protein